MTARVIANVSCVAIGGRAVIFEGAPGAGKSTLALALIDRGALLVGDDGIILERRHGQVWALPPPTIEGLIEVRGVGLIDLPTIAAPVALSVTLGIAGARLPDVGTRNFAGIAVAHFDFPGFDASTALRVEWALRLHGLVLPAGIG